MTALPQHIAIIMDGNGRWAKARGLHRTFGHKQGAEAVKRTVRAAAELGIRYLTLFGFSSENWSRPADEVRELMRLLRIYLRSEMAELHRSNVCLKVIGDRAGLEKDITDLIQHAERLTAGNTGLTLTIALNYGGRQELLRAASDWAQDCLAKGMPPDMNAAEEFLPDYLQTAGMPDPDILVRTSGEQRISNFLLWQCAYAEYVFLPVLWPDFGKSDLEQAIAEFSKRDRRFGAVSAR